MAAQHTVDVLVRVRAPLDSLENKYFFEIEDPGLKKSLGLSILKS